MKGCVSRLAAVAGLVLAAGCSSDEDKSKSGSPAEFVLKTTEFQVPAGEEKYLCYAKTLEEDMVVDRFDYAARPVIAPLPSCQSADSRARGLLGVRRPVPLFLGAHLHRGLR